MPILHRWCEGAGGARGEVRAGEWTRRRAPRAGGVLAGGMRTHQMPASRTTERGHIRHSRHLGPSVVPLVTAARNPIRLITRMYFPTASSSPQDLRRMASTATDPLWPPPPPPGGEPAARLTRVRGMDKVVSTPADAVAGITDGATIAVGGFGLCGIPSVLIAELHDTGVSDLEVVSNNCGVDGWGLGVLLAAGQ